MTLNHKIARASVLLCLLLFQQLPVFSSDKLPNFIIIYTDDQRYDALGGNNNQVVITPAIDAFFSKGMRFTNAHVVFSLCSPSRAALLTGRYGSANGVLELDSKLNPDEQTVAQYLKEAGYQTGISGKWHLDQPPDKLGFEFSVYFKGNGTYYNRRIVDEGTVVQPAKHCDEYCVDRSIDFLSQAAESGKPFLLFHNTQLPHMNGELIWDAKEDTKAKYRVKEMPVAENRLDPLENKPEYLKTVRNKTQAANYGYPDKDAIQAHTLDYYSVITEMDQALGRLFSSIKQLNLLNNTYVIYMSDNGWMLGDHGFTSKVLPYHPSTSVPLFILGPFVKPSINDELVSNIDIAPTLLAWAGIEAPNGIHGKSLTGIISGHDSMLRPALVYEGLGLYGGAKPNLSVITSDYRYIRTFEDNSLKKVSFEELYRINDDPWEIHNLAHNRQYANLMEELRQYIEYHRKTILKLN